MYSTIGFYKLYTESKKQKQNDNKMIYKLYTTWSTIHNLVGVARGGGGGCG